jgi:hypothetical protein
MGPTSALELTMPTTLTSEHAPSYVLSRAPLVLTCATFSLSLSLSLSLSVCLPVCLSLCLSVSVCLLRARALSLSLSRSLALALSHTLSANLSLYSSWNGSASLYGISSSAAYTPANTCKTGRHRHRHHNQNDFYCAYMMERQRGKKDADECMDPATSTNDPATSTRMHRATRVHPATCTRTYTLATH